MSIKHFHIEDGAIIQGDGSSAKGIDKLAPQKLYVVQDRQLHLVRDISEFRKAGLSHAAVKIIPDAELAELPVAAEPRMAPGEQIALDLDSFLGAGHYMTTHGVLRKTASGAHADATTRTRTVTWFGGFHGGVNMLYSDAQGYPVGMSDTQRFGVDGTWVGRSDRTDYWSQDLSEDWASRTTDITIFHFWAPDQLDDVVRRGVAMVKPVVEIIADIVKLGGKAASS
jgi:hypothetical protein